jgi:hypothetical protein
MDSDEDYEEDQAPNCPFCGSQDSCEHLLLLVDQTFRTAEGGAMFAAFNTRWSEICEAGGDDFDEREPFEQLLDEVDSLAEASQEYDFEGGPGMSSTYVAYYIESPERVQTAAQNFSRRGGE